MTRRPPSIADRDRIDAVVFDMDGVITDTAEAHAAAWKRLFDEFLRRRADRTGAPFEPFDPETEYRAHVDGKPRFDGVRDFLAARGIDLPEGDPDDPPERETVRGLGNRKNGYFRDWLSRNRVRARDDALDLLRRLRAAGVGCGVISSSRNAAAVLGSAGVAELFDACVDGVESARLGLTGKPDPAIFLEAARRLGAEPRRCAVIEDALSGVEAGARGGFALVVGLAREGSGAGHDAALRARGADVVVRALTELMREDWTLAYEGYEPDGEGVRETLCALGNGYFCTRAAAPDSVADGVHYPGTYLAGGYDRLTSEVRGREVENEDLVNLPNWLGLTLRIADGPWLRPDEVEMLDYRQELDLAGGVLSRSLRFRDAAGRTTRWEERRIVSMDDPHLGALSVAVTAEDWSGRLAIRSEIDGTVTNAGVARYGDLRGRHLETTGVGGEGDLVWLRSRTVQSRLSVALAARTRVFADGAEAAVARRPADAPDLAAQELSLDMAEGGRATVEKVVALHSSRDPAISEPALAARERAAEAADFDALLARHRAAWRRLWAEFDIRVETHDSNGANLKLRVHIFHLLQTVSRHSVDRDVGVPPRGWTGEAYRGHVMWDELFIFPFLNLREPILTRALLRYRQRRLPAARRMAREAGRAGAMYPWQSGSDGREESQTLHLNPASGRWIPDNSHRQRHIAAAVAWNVWQYHEATDDRRFLDDYGAEMLVEIARFFASAATHDPARDRYEIRGVMGPDEFHTAYPGADPSTEGGLNNNAYTNVMAAWTLNRAQDALDLLPPDKARALRERLGVSRADCALWEEISRKLVVPFHDGVISQFEGYEALEEFDWEGYRARYGDLGRLDRILEAEGDDPNRYKVSKQADALMLFYLLSAEELALVMEQLGYPFDPETIPRTIDYYARRTSHGSTLSRIVHAWVLARADRPRSWRLLQDALDSDLKDIQGGTTREGVHLGAMAGTVDIVQRCYTGVETRAGVLLFNPTLSDRLRRLEACLHYRGQDLDVEVTHERLRVSSRPSNAAPIHVAYRGRYRELGPGRASEFRLITPPERDRGDVAADQAGETPR